MLGRSEQAMLMISNKFLVIPWYFSGYLSGSIMWQIILWNIQLSPGQNKMQDFNRMTAYHESLKLTVYDEMRVIISSRVIELRS